MEICIDFDGTCVKNEFPKVGADIGAVPVLKELVANGHRLILFTMRSNPSTPQPFDRATDRSAQGTADDVHPEIVRTDGNFLDDAILWFKENGIPLYGIQSNPTQKRWTKSPKAYGQLYIDDAALGCPLVYNFDKKVKPYVDWVVVREMLVLMGLIL